MVSGSKKKLLKLSHSLSGEAKGKAVPYSLSYFNLPNTPGHSMTSDIRNLQSNVHKNKLQVSDSPEIKEVLQLMSELRAEEEALSEAVKTLDTNVQPRDALLAHRVSMEHARKVTDLIEAFNQLPGNKFKMSNYHPVRQSAQDIKSMHQDVLFGQYAVAEAEVSDGTRQYLMGKIEGKNADGTYDIRYNDKIHKLKDDKFKILKNLEEDYLPTKGIYVMYKGHLRKLMGAKKIEGVDMAMLDDG